MARCSRCGIDFGDDVERCPRCLRTSTVARAGVGRSETWGALSRDVEAPLGWAPTIMSMGLVLLVAGALLGIHADHRDSSLVRWTTFGALALVYGFQREIRAIGAMRTIVVFVAVALAGVSIGGGLLAIFFFAHTSERTAIAWLVGAAVSYVVGTWALTRAMDRAR